MKYYQWPWVWNILSPLAKFYHNHYTLGLQILYSCVYISHEHEYIFYFFIVQLWKLTEASWSSKVIVSGNWNGCHIKATSNCQIKIGWMLLTSVFGIHIQSTQNHNCHNRRQRIKIHWIVLLDFVYLKSCRLLACACKFLDSLMQRIRLDLEKHLCTSWFWCAENHLLKSWACQTRLLHRKGWFLYFWESWLVQKKTQKSCVNIKRGNQGFQTPEAYQTPCHWSYRPSFNWQL